MNAGGLIPRKFDLTSNPASKKRLSPEEVRNILALRSTNPNRKIEVNRKSQALKVRKPLTAKSREKKKILYEFKYNIW